MPLDPYGWPSGEIVSKDGEEKILFFRQNFGGMFGLKKERGKIYNPVLFTKLIELATKRKEHFNKNYFNENISKFPNKWGGGIKNKINFLLDFGIDEVWISLFVMSKLGESVYAVPILLGTLNFNRLEANKKKNICRKIKINEKISEIDNNYGLFMWWSDENARICTALEIAIMSEILNIKNYDLDVSAIDKDTVLPTMLNLYPAWDNSSSYRKLKITLDEIASKNIDFADTVLLQRSDNLVG